MTHTFLLINFKGKQFAEILTHACKSLISYMQSDPSLCNFSETQDTEKIIEFLASSVGNLARFSHSLSKSNINEWDFAKFRNSLTITLYPREVILKLREKLVKRDVFKELFVDPKIKEEYVDHEILQNLWKYLDSDNSDFSLIPKLFSSNKEAILLRVGKPGFSIKSQLVVF